MCVEAGKPTPLSWAKTRPSSYLIAQVVAHFQTGHLKVGLRSRFWVNGAPTRQWDTSAPARCCSGPLSKEFDFSSCQIADRGANVWVKSLAIQCNRPWPWSVSSKPFDRQHDKCRRRSVWPFPSPVQAALPSWRGARGVGSSILGIQRKHSLTNGHWFSTKETVAALPVQ